MACIFVLAISVLFLNKFAERHEEKKNRKNTPEINFEITGSIQVDINTLLCEFPRDPRSQAPSRRGSRIPFGLFNSRGSIFSDGSKNNMTKSYNIVNSVDVFDGVKSNLSLQVPQENYGYRKKSVQQAVITDSDGNVCQMIPMSRKHSILNYMP